MQPLSQEAIKKLKADMDAKITQLEAKLGVPLTNLKKNIKVPVDVFTLCFMPVTGTCLLRCRRPSSTGDELTEAVEKEGATMDRASRVGSPGR